VFLNKRKSTYISQKRSLIAYSNPNSLIAEQFRTIRTNIRFLTEKEKKAVLLITSPSKGEGKSTTAANIAVSMAQQKEKVLIIDANLREPELHSIFKISNKVGLTDVLTGKSTFEDAIYPTEIGRLAVLTSGVIPFNPTEILGLDKLGDLLREAKQIYDIILIDSPGILEVADTKVLANSCDGVIIVLSEGSTSKFKAIEAKKALDFTESKILGVVFNVIR
jgi:capsular exopolysaccharide synthesis family protein